MRILEKGRFTPEYLTYRHGLTSVGIPDSRERKALKFLANQDGDLDESEYLADLADGSTRILTIYQPTTNISDQSGVNQLLGALRRHARCVNSGDILTQSFQAAKTWYVSRNLIDPRIPNPLRRPRAPLPRAVLQCVIEMNLTEVLGDICPYVKLGVCYILSSVEGILVSARPRELWDLTFGDEERGNPVSPVGDVTIRYHKSQRLNSNLERRSFRIRDFAPPDVTGYVMRHRFQSSSACTKAINLQIQKIIAVTCDRCQVPVPVNEGLGSACRLLRFSAGHHAASVAEPNWPLICGLFGHSKAIHKKHYF
jgi:hypothetical protein